MSSTDVRTEIAVLDYGIGNLRSAEKALRHLGADAELVGDPERARDAEAIVLPGVGAFGPCMEALRKSSLDEIVREAVDQDRPVLGICVGMQLLYEGSQEAPGVGGLGICTGTIRRIAADVKLPQMQWNRLELLSAEHPMFARLSPGPWAYFVHSFCAPHNDDVVATCSYGGSVVAAIGRDNLWATQFHPEKSGMTGLLILAQFVDAVRRRAQPAAAEAMS